MRNEEKCTTLHCRGSCDIRVLGKCMCWSCWENKCQQENKEIMEEVNKKISEKADVLGLSFMLRKKE